MMQVSKDTPDELSALTKPLARCKACADSEEAAQGEGQCSEDACNGQSKIWGLHRLDDALEFI